MSELGRQTLQSVSRAWAEQGAVDAAAAPIVVISASDQSLSTPFIAPSSRIGAPQVFFLACLCAGATTDHLRSVHNQPIAAELRQ
jgi:hypothetical protein